MVSGDNLHFEGGKLVFTARWFMDETSYATNCLCRGTLHAIYDIRYWFPDSDRDC